MPIFLILFAGAFAALIGWNVWRWMENERSPVLTEPAHLRKKITESHLDANGVMNTTLLLIFDLEGLTLKCTVPGRVYREVREGADGLLTHQGTRFRCFEFEGIRVEK